MWKVVWNPGPLASASRSGMFSSPRSWAILAALIVVLAPVIILIALAVVVFNIVLLLLAAAAWLNSLPRRLAAFILGRPSPGYTEPPAPPEPPEPLDDGRRNVRVIRREE